jgi:putative sterol carrier protein
MKPNWIALAVFLVFAPACTRDLICVYPNAPTAASSPEVKEAPAKTAKGAEKEAPEAAEEGSKSTDATPAAPAAEPPLPDGRVRNAKEYFATLRHRFKPDAAKDLHAIFQFDLTGPEALTYHVDVDNGSMKLEKGKAEKPNVTLTASAEDYVKIVNGELGGFGAVMGNKLQVGGDIGLAHRMSDIFPPGHPGK